MSLLARIAACRPSLAHSFVRSVATTADRAQLATGPAKSAASSEQVQVPFSSLKGVINDYTLEALVSRPFQLKNMTAVQAAVLPLLPQIALPPSPDSTAPRDLLVKAKTGTGKTLGFLIPSLEARLNKLKEVETRAAEEASESKPKAAGRAARNYAKKYVGTLIISPTRELASQIAVEATRLAAYHEGFEVQLFTGGASKGFQMRNWLSGRRDIVVTTPGRLLDYLKSEPSFKDAFSEVQVLVLDEADTLLDMGFRDDIESIVEYLPEKKDRQTFLFSATVSSAIHQIAKKTMNNNHTFINTVTEETSPVHSHVPQYHTVLPNAKEQIPHLVRLIAHDQLTNLGKSKIIVFLPTTKMTQLFTTLLRSLKKHLPAGRTTEVYEIHGKKAQESRTNTSNSFRKDTSGASVLVTSDVSARGIDYPNVTRVIQVGVPTSTDQYVHRIGRTGRRDLAGRGDLILLPWEVGFVTHQMTEIPTKPLPLETIKEEVLAVADKLDQEGLPQSLQPRARPRFRQYEEGRPAQGQVSFQTPLVPVVSHIDKAVEELLEELDPNAVNEVFTSLLGYYFGRSGELRCTKEVILEGCRDFTTSGLGLSEAPYVSAAFLQKIGFSEPRRRDNSKRDSGRSNASPRFGLRGRPDETRFVGGRSESRSDGSLGDRSGGRFSNRSEGRFGDRSQGRFSDRSEGRSRRFDSGSGSEGGFRARRLSRS